MFLGQHHGLPTRLLDWTTNPLVAAYFAVEKKYSKDSYIYFINMEAKRIDNFQTYDPFKEKAIVKLVPTYIAKRIINQDGRFTLHPNPELPMDHMKKYDNRFGKIIIKNKFRKRFKQLLFKFGIHRASLFPDLDGLSQHIEWMKSKSH